MSIVNMISPAGLVAVPSHEVGMKQKIGWTVKQEAKPVEKKEENKVDPKTDTQVLMGLKKKGK